MTLSDSELTQLFENIHTIAAVGVNDFPGTSEHEVFSYQQSQGYDIIPVTKKPTTVLGKKSTSSLAEIQQPVDLVNVFVTGPLLAEAINTAVQQHVKGVWLQPGVEDDLAEKKIRDASITLVKGRCFQQEHRRLMAHKPM